MPIKLLLKESYLSLIENSPGTRMFVHFYGLISSQKRKSKKDLTQNGLLSCAYFVSSVLKIFNLIGEIHLTVKGTLKDMEKSGWFLIKRPRKGSILLWEEKEFGKNDKHFHLGFYLGNNLAVSNSSQKKKIVFHHWTYQGRRKVIAVYWHKKLD